MRTTIWSVLTGLALLIPAGLAAQDQESDRDDGHDRDPHHSGGLREVSEHPAQSGRSGFWLSAGIGGGA